MPVFRVSKNRDFTVIANSVFKDRRLSAKAKGILVEMLSLPENWDYTLKGLTTLFSDGIDSIRQGIKELEEKNGYIVRERKRDARGRLGGMEYVIYETPEKAVENSVENTTPESTEPIDDTPAKDFPVQEVSIEDKAMLYKELNESRTKESSTHLSNPYQSITEEAADVMGYDEARETVKENIEYEILSERYPVERLDEIVDIASEALCSKRSSFSLHRWEYD